MVKFEVGKTYFMNSAYDHNCIWNCTVISRTAQFVTLKTNGESMNKRVKTRMHNDVECCQPFGKYSFSPVLDADREAK